jgi:hypothetical protein
MCCWHKKLDNKSFCINLASLGGPRDKASRIVDNDTREREEVACDPFICPYRKAEVDDKQKCRNLTKLGVHLDLPGSESGAGFYGVSTCSYYSKENLENQMALLRKLTCGFIAQIPLSIVQVKRTVKTKDKSGRDIYIIARVLCLKPRVGYEQMIKLAHSHAAFVELAGRARVGLDKIQARFEFTKEDVDMLVNEYEEVVNEDEEYTAEIESQLGENDED